MEARPRQLLPVLAVTCAVGLAAVAAGGSGLSGAVLPPPREEVPTPLAPSATASVSVAPVAGADDPVTGPRLEWLDTVVAGIFIAILVGTVGLFLYAGVRYLLTERVRFRELVDQAASQPGGGLESEQLREAVRAGLADIDAGGDPRRAVIACWLRLERLAAAAGTARLAADTPTDLVTRLLARHRVSDRALERLAGAYRVARYAPA